jgi:MgtC family
MKTALTQSLHNIIADWYQTLPSLAAYPALIMTAVVCGAIIGIEREKKIKPAGFRTMILIALGSALFTMLSYLMSAGEADRGRVAAQIVSGIGFLGAGAIIHDTVRIRGLTGGHDLVYGSGRHVVRCGLRRRGYFVDVRADPVNAPGDPHRNPLSRPLLSHPGHITIR